MRHSLAVASLVVLTHPSLNAAARIVSRLEFGLLDGMGLVGQSHSSLHSNQQGVHDTGYPVWCVRCPPGNKHIIISNVPTFRKCPRSTWRPTTRSDHHTSTSVPIYATVSAHFSFTFSHFQPPSVPYSLVPMGRSCVSSLQVHALAL